MNYFIANGGQQRGPFPLDKLLVEGLRSDSMVWREGMPEWKQAGEVPELPPNASDEDVRELALNDPKVLSSLDGKQVVKAIVVPHKLVNIVVR